MSATLRCDGCKNLIDGQDVTTPRMQEEGDLKPRQSRVTGSIARGHAAEYIPDPVKDDEQNLREQRSGIPGYPIKRRGFDPGNLVALWVTWRPEEDYCSDCVENAICAAADAIRKESKR